MDDWKNLDRDWLLRCADYQSLGDRLIGWAAAIVIALVVLGGFLGYL